ncbi:T9SS type A sorting domain-containing protein [Winogradskyella sp. SYSU M77433]|uniref:T9SS type A sorting domain-containing protein n=1 Tax=Winogradskyella sp. SYSU M77433 TaxID=3042722 RepID=UPI002480F929|nr:T9SS type A sorting domain-containing protein [Winogradskyella sp. SYSU M77433]MDH7912112.1 T9SS type A sorting domain-containing protein [Winogradskyella sp. SYSU M77433]
MKKIYFLFFTLISLVSFGQNLAANGGFESWTAGVPDLWTTIDFSTADLTENTNATFISEGTSSASVNVLTQTQGDTDMRQTVSLTGGVTYTMSLDVYATNNEARARIFNGNGFSPAVYSDETLLNQWQTLSFEYTPASDEDFEFGIRFYDLSSNWVSASLFYIDNLQIVAAVEPSIAVTSPADGSTIPSSDVDIEISVQNFNVASGGSGDGYIVYSVDGGASIDKFDSAPISLSSLVDGSHTVELELVDNGGASLTNPATASVSFDVTTITQVANITALRAGTLGEFYELTGEAIISYIVTEGTRNQKYIQDVDAGILIDDTAGTLSTSFNIGDGITGLQGQLTEYAGTLQFVPSVNVASASSTGNSLTPISISAAELITNGETYESRLITLNNVTFQDSGVFADNTNYNVADGTDVTICRVAFGDEDLIGETIPTNPVNITGLGGQFNADYQIFPRYASDIIDPLSLDNVNSNAFSLYPNPTNTGSVNITSNNTGDMLVEVYDILGKRVKNQTLTNNTLNLSSLKSGIYIVKITQNNASVTKKLVIK